MAAIQSQGDCNMTHYWPELKALKELLEQIDSLEGVTHSRDLPSHEAEAVWDEAVARARLAVEKAEKRLTLSQICDATVLPKAAWFIWQKFGHPPRFAHGSEDAALREAKRLAAKCPGVSFIVMRAEYKIRVEAPERAAPAEVAA